VPFALINLVPPRALLLTTILRPPGTFSTVQSPSDVGFRSISVDLVDAGVGERGLLRAEATASAHASPVAQRMMVVVWVALLLVRLGSGWSA
jgi:hypothetical protein